MKSHLFGLGPAVAALAVLGPAGPAAAQTVLPIHVTTETSQNLPTHRVPGNPGRLFIQLGSEGEGSPLTHFRTIGSQTNPLDPQGNPIAVNYGRTTFFADNGDGFFISYSGVSRIGATPTTIIQDIPFTVTGGMGSLTGATGSGRVTVIVDLQTASATTAIEGNLVLPKDQPPPGNRHAEPITGQFSSSSGRSLLVGLQTPLENVQVRMSGNTTAPAASGVRLTGQHNIIRAALFINYNGVVVAPPGPGGTNYETTFTILGGRGHYRGAGGQGTLIVSTTGRTTTFSIDGIALVGGQH